MFASACIIGHLLVGNETDSSHVRRADSFDFVYSVEPIFA